MRLPFRGLALLVPALLAAPVVRAAADPLTILASDERGVTLRLATEAWSLSAPGPDGRVHVVGVPAAHSLVDPGHALLPAYSALLALPPDARPTARVISADAPDERTGVRLAIAGKPSFTRDDQGGFEPGLDDVPPLRDGMWPVRPVEVGEPTSFRGRRLVGLEVRPFAYDEAAGTLRAVHGMVVRVDFNRPAGAAALPAIATAPDPHVDEVLRNSVLNFDTAAPWRVAPEGQRSQLFRATPAAAAGAGFDESQPEVRVRIDSTGVWLLPYDLLAGAGYPHGVPVAQVSVHRHEFLEGATGAPYATYEVPIEVEDANGNGVFDSGDRIWMFVRSWADRAQPSRYQRWWGDADAFFVTLKPAGGLRMATKPGWRNSAAPTVLTSYPQFTHWERNSAIIMPYINAPTDTVVDVYQWTGASFYYSRSDSIQFSVNSIDTTHAVQFAVNWVGRGFGPHNEWAAVENAAGVMTSVADSVLWYDKSPYTATATLHGSAFSEGWNRFVPWGKASPAAPSPTGNYIDFVGMDWFEATYWRRFDAVHDVLAFNNAGVAGEYQAHLSGFLSDSLRAYDITNPDAPVRIVLDEAHVQRGGSVLTFDFQDSAATGAPRSYIVAAAQDPLDPAFGPRVPAADHVALVSRQQLWQLSGCDYLVIVPEAFMSAIQPLVALRQSQGLHVVVASAEDVYDEFNGGRHAATAIQRFAKFAYNQWSTRFLLLVGDGSLDPNDYEGRSGPDVIPVLPVPGPVRVGDGYEITVSDNLYGCITGNCDPITTFQPVIPELMVGRLPVNTLADVNAVVAKLVGYENLAGDPSWRRHLLLLSDDAFSSDAFSTFGGSAPGYCWKSYELHFAGLNQKVRSVVYNEGGLSQMNVENFNLRYYLASEPYFVDAYGDTCRPDRMATRSRTHAGVTPVLFSHLNAGTLWWNFQGHANEYVLTHEDLYINSGDIPGSDDKFLFANTNQPTFYTAFSCHANMFARGEGVPGGTLGGCLGEDMVTLPGKGAVASWASDCYEVVPGDDSTHINVELARSMFSIPPHDATLSDRGARVVLGEVIQESFLRFLPGQFSNPSVRGIGVTYTLLGDPATRMSIGRPQSLVTANDSIVTDGLAVRMHSPGDTLTLVGDLVSTVRLDSLGLWMSTSGGPDLPVPASSYTLSPAFPDTAGGGVTGGRRFRLTYGTHLPAQTRRYTFRIVDRDGLASTFAALFSLDATLRVDGVPIHDGDDISPIANLSVNLVSPAPITPGSDVVINVNGVAQSFTSAPAPGDASGREWILTFTHAPFPKDNYQVDIVVRGASDITHRFTVSTATGDLKLSNLFAFPNPFDNAGTTFSFQLLGSDAADVRVSVYTISGRRIWSQEWRGLPPGYHQLPWDANDAEGAAIANGVYFYRLSAATAAGKHADQLGRLVKLRKPRHVDLPATP